MSHKEQVFQLTQVVWYIFYVIETILALRFILLALGANTGAFFTQLVYGVSGVLVAPFAYVFSTPSVGEVAFEFSTLLAMLVYWLAAWGLVKLILMKRDVEPREIDESLRSQDSL